MDHLIGTVGVTPAVMSKDATEATLDLLGEMGDKMWDDYLVGLLEEGYDWTEYGLYAAGACLT